MEHCKIQTIYEFKTSNLEIRFMGKKKHNIFLTEKLIEYVILQHVEHGQAL